MAPRELSLGVYCLTPEGLITPANQSGGQARVDRQGAGYPLQQGSSELWLPLPLDIPLGVLGTMAAVSITDASDLTWLIYPGDPLWEPCALLQRAGFTLSELIFPDELPRRLEMRDPDWPRVCDLWATEGDTPALRKEVKIQQVRQVIRAHEQAKQAVE